jgi:hypothetical protein
MNVPDEIILYNDLDKSPSLAKVRINRNPESSLKKARDMSA